MSGSAAPWVTDLFKVVRMLSYSGFPRLRSSLIENIAWDWLWRINYKWVGRPVFHLALEIRFLLEVFSAQHRCLWHNSGTEFFGTGWGSVMLYRICHSAVRTSIAFPPPDLEAWYDSKPQSWCTRPNSRGLGLIMKGQVLLGDKFHELLWLDVSLSQRRFFISVDDIVDRKEARPCG